MCNSNITLRKRSSDLYCMMLLLILLTSTLAARGTNCCDSSEAIRFLKADIEEEDQADIEMVPPHFSISELQLHPAAEPASLTTTGNPVVGTPTPTSASESSKASSTATTAAKTTTSAAFTTITTTTTTATPTTTEELQEVETETETENEDENENGNEYESVTTQETEVRPIFGEEAEPNNTFAAHTTPNYNISGYESTINTNEWINMPEEPAEEERSVVKNEQCNFEVKCKAPQKRMPMLRSVMQRPATSNTTVRIPVVIPAGIRGPPGARGDKGNRGAPGVRGIDGLSALPPVKIAFFVGLANNLGPLNRAEDVKFEKLVTNVGNAYDEKTGKFSAPNDGTYMFHVTIAAQGDQRAAVRLLTRSHGVNESRVVFTLWCESIPYWSSTSNSATLRLRHREQVWVRALSTASAIHGYMYSTFSGYILFSDDGGTTQ